MKYRICLSIFLILVSATVSATAPFGIGLGWTVEELERAGMIAEPVYGYEEYYWVDPLYPVPFFTDYVVKVSDEYGVYSITAYSDDIPCSPAGTEVKAYFIQLESELDQAFGEGDRYWDVGTDSPTFMADLLEEETYFYTEWYPEYGNYIADDIIDAALILYPVDMYTGQIRLEYWADTYWDAEFLF